MDNLEIHDPQQSNLDNESRVQRLLDAKIEEASQTTEENSHSCENVRPNKNAHSRKRLPDYSFKFTAYEVKDSVEYEIQLLEKFKVFRKTITENYNFKSKYSKLQSLSEKLGSKGFPPKKLFGNKNPKFITKRMQQLEDYLNARAAEKSPQFLQFIKQIKQASLYAEFNDGFKLP